MTVKNETRWYVYTLVDPRDGSVFYIGKGSGSRIHQHEKDAAKPETVCSKKINRIRDIQAAKLGIEKGYSAFFWDEQAAYDHETDLIEEHGLESLTNVLPGGQKAWERRQQKRAAARREKESEPLHVWMSRKGADLEALYQRFSEWLKAGLHKGGKVRITTDDPRYKWNAIVSEVVYNQMIPMMWKQINADERAQKVFADRIRRYGVEIV